jgi:hypothetical protein
MKIYDGAISGNSLKVKWTADALGIRKWTARCKDSLRIH